MMNKKLLVGLMAITNFIHAATINLDYANSNNKLVLKVRIDGVSNSVSNLHYNGLDGATTLSNQLFLNDQTNGTFNSELIIVPDKSATYNVTATATVDGVNLTSNKVKVVVSDQDIKQAQAQIHQAESVAVKEVQAAMPVIKQEIQQQQQFMNDLSNAINKDANSVNSSNN